MQNKNILTILKPLWFLQYQKPVAINVNDFTLTHFSYSSCVHTEERLGANLLHHEEAKLAESNPLQLRRAVGHELIYLHWDDNIEPVLAQVALWNHAVVAGYCSNKRNA